MAVIKIRPDAESPFEDIAAIKGRAGSMAYSGTAVTGTSTTPTVYATGIESANVGDRYYYNGTTDEQIGNVYRCTLGGNAATALWVYDRNDRGEAGAGDVSTVDSILPDGAGNVQLDAMRMLTATDANAITVPGIHLLASDASNVPGSGSNWIIMHTPYDASNAAQEAMAVSASALRYYRKKVAGAWGAWTTLQSILGQSNPNLLINPYCRINQRGSASYSTAQYGYDMWTADTAAVTRAYTNSQTQLTATGAVAANDRIHLQKQYWQGGLCPYIGEMMTLSTKIDAVSGTHAILLIAFRDASYTLISSDSVSIDATGLKQVTATIPAGTYYIDCAIAADGTGMTSGDYVYYDGIKLEKGDISTLLSDTPRPDSDELERCLAYHWRGVLMGTFGHYYVSGAFSYLFAGQRNFSPPMVATPTITIVTAPTLTNCDTLTHEQSKDGFTLRVNSLAAGLYRAQGGVYDASAEP